MRPWASEEPPPSHSVPPAVAGKVAASFRADAFDRFHLALMRADFSDNRTISEPAVMPEVAAAVGLDREEFASRLADGDGSLAAAVVADHEDALTRGVAAVPTVVVDDEYVLTGAMSVEQYSRIVARLGG